MSETSPLVGIAMGSESDWPVMQAASDVLTRFGVPHETRVLSAHRTPEKMTEYALSARDRGLKVIIGAAGGAAHLPGMLAASTTLPVIGVPIPTKHLKGIDSLLSIAQMPGGVPVATVAIGQATNAALLAVQILAVSDPQLAAKLDDFRAEEKARVAEMDRRVGKSG